MQGGRFMSMAMFSAKEALIPGSAYDRSRPSAYSQAPAFRTPASAWPASAYHDPLAYIRPDPGQPGGVNIPVPYQMFLPPPPLPAAFANGPARADDRRRSRPPPRFGGDVPPRFQQGPPPPEPYSQDTAPFAHSQGSQDIFGAYGGSGSQGAGSGLSASLWSQPSLQGPASQNAAPGPGFPHHSQQSQGFSQPAAFSQVPLPSSGPWSDISDRLPSQDPYAVDEGMRSEMEALLLSQDNTNPPHYRGTQAIAHPAMDISCLHAREGTQLPVLSPRHPASHHHHWSPAEARKGGHKESTIFILCEQTKEGRDCGLLLATRGHAPHPQPSRIAAPIYLSLEPHQRTVAERS